jgi:hypothetical protein
MVMLHHHEHLANLLTISPSIECHLLLQHLQKLRVQVSFSTEQATSPRPVGRVQSLAALVSKERSL